MARGVDKQSDVLPLLYVLLCSYRLYFTSVRERKMRAKLLLSLATRQALFLPKPGLSFPVPLFLPPAAATEVLVASRQPPRFLEAPVGHLWEQGCLASTSGQTGSKLPPWGGRAERWGGNLEPWMTAVLSRLTHREVGYRFSKWTCKATEMRRDLLICACGSMSVA
nr:uncharacterized protein LOC127333028 isoform X1 [Lolium perenne]